METNKGLDGGVEEAPTLPHTRGELDARHVPTVEEEKVLICGDLERELGVGAVATGGQGVGRGNRGKLKVGGVQECVEGGDVGGRGSGEGCNAQNVVVYGVDGVRELEIGDRQVHDAVLGLGKDLAKGATAVGVRQERGIVLNDEHHVGGGHGDGGCSVAVGVRPVHARHVVAGDRVVVGNRLGRRLGVGAGRDGDEDVVAALVGAGAQFSGGIGLGKDARGAVETVGVEVDSQVTEEGIAFGLSANGVLHGSRADFIVDAGDEVIDDVVDHGTPALDTYSGSESGDFVRGGVTEDKAIVVDQSDVVDDRTCNSSNIKDNGNFGTGNGGIDELGARKIFQVLVKGNCMLVRLFGMVWDGLGEGGLGGGWGSVVVLVVGGNLDKQGLLLCRCPTTYLSSDIVEYARSITA